MLLKKVKLSEIKEAVYQPRQQKEKDIEELIKSILNCGLLTNITLRKEKKGYKIIYGNRRVSALRRILKVGKEELPEGNARIVDGDIEIDAIVLDKISDVDAAFNSYVENLEREDLTPLDKGFFYLDMVENFGMEEEEIARRLGITRRTIINNITYLKNIPEEILKAWKDDKISSEHVEIIMTLETREKQLKLLRLVIDRRLNVVETEMSALRMRDEDNIPTKERMFYFIEKKFYENEDFAQYVREGRIQLRGSRKGKWVSFNLHSPRDFKSMLQLIIDLLPEEVLKRMERG